MTSRTILNRRRFLRRSGAVAGAIPVLGLPNILAARAPNEKLGIAVIGCGGQGGGNPVSVRWPPSNTPALTCRDCRDPGNRISQLHKRGITIIPASPVNHQGKEVARSRPRGWQHGDQDHA